MTIEKKVNGSELTFLLAGRLDTTTAPQLESEFKQNIEGKDSLILDFEQLEYLSSAGLRVLLSAQKTMTEPLPAKAGRFTSLLKQPKVVYILRHLSSFHSYPISKLSDLFFSCKS